MKPAEIRELSDAQLVEKLKEMRAELIGHAWFQAPDSDGAVHLDASEASVGDILTVEFTDSFCYELIGHVVE